MEPEFKRLTISIIFNFQFGTDLEFTDPLIDSLLVCTEKIIASCQKASDLMPIFEIFTSVCILFIIIINSVVCYYV